MQTDGGPLCMKKCKFWNVEALGNMQICHLMHTLLIQSLFIIQNEKPMGQLTGIKLDWPSEVLLRLRERTTMMMIHSHQWLD